MPAANVCGVDTVASDLMTSLTTGYDFSLPVVDLGSPDFATPAMPELAQSVTTLTNDNLTTTHIDGTGTFDVLMRGFETHLKREFDEGRITGQEYSKTYIALTESAMNNGVQFLLGKDMTFWSAVKARMEAHTARVELETAKARLQAIRYEAMTNKAAFALAQMKIASESVTYCSAKYTLDNLLPLQRTLLTEQAEAQRAQTSDTRSDGVPVSGAIGKQKELQAQQVISYKRDGEVKVSKMFIDAWITMKTMDEGLTAPNGFTNANIDTLLTALRNKNELT